jgi:formylglycine-generating enzyme
MLRSPASRTRPLRIVIVGALGALVACATVAGIDNLVIGECKGGVCADVPDAPANLDTGAIAPDDSGVPCLGKPLPSSIRVGTAGNTFCIDTTEITNEQYGEFLDAGVPPITQPELCQWNATFATQFVEAGARDPVVGVDWCDALAYCTWAGKYLCGRMEDGRKVGAVTPETASDYHSHQWMNACSAEARRRYPYGGVYDPSRCNLGDYDAGRILPVGSAVGCQGGYEGIFDLVGNVWEWYDGPCLDGGLIEDGGDGGPQSDSCWLKSSAYGNTGQAFDCRFDLENIRRDSVFPNVGFRCCSD